MTLVLMSPIGLDAELWRFGDLLSEPGTCVYEAPGFGGRQRAVTTPTMGVLADEVAAAHSGPLDLVGVSMGGMIALHVCARHPARVRSAVIACAGASADRAAMIARAEAAEAGGMGAMLEGTLERWFTPAALAGGDHPGEAYVRRTLLALDPAAFADGWRAIAGHDVRRDLRSVKARITVVVGRDDVAVPAATCEEIVRLAPSARLVALDGPHMLPLERAESFTAAVREHIWAATRA